MRHWLVAGLALVMLGSRAALAQGACESLSRPVPGGTLDAAPLSGHVDVCAEDAALCYRLTAGYPPSVTTLAYLVPDAEWDLFRRGETRGFRQYLIAQHARSMTAAHLPGFKAYMHAQQGDIADNTEPPASIEVGARKPLGILAETERSITFGILVRIRPAGHGDATSITLAATNSMLAIGDRVLSLYVFREYQTSDDLQAARELTKAWIECLERGNAAAGAAVGSAAQ